MNDFIINFMMTLISLTMFYVTGGSECSTTASVHKNGQIDSSGTCYCRLVSVLRRTFSAVVCKGITLIEFHHRKVKGKGKRWARR